MIDNVTFVVIGKNEALNLGEQVHVSVVEK